MKKVLYILNDGMRKFTYARTAGLYRAIQNAEEDINLYILRSDGYSGFAPGHNCGEYNIFRLPDYGDFDGIFLDINHTYKAEADDFAAQGALYAVRAAAAAGKPVISMANAIEGFYYVGIDNRVAMTTMIRHLHEAMGLSDFWFAMGPVDNFEGQTRAQALRDYCRENGLPCGEDRFYWESFIMECGIHAFEQLRDQWQGRLPQAVVCANDQIATGVCQAARAAGLRVPRDFFVTGFDNLDVSAYLSPSITTIDQLPWNMGDACVDAMCRIWRGEDVPRIINIPTQLLLRESTGHPDTRTSDLKKQVTEFISRDSSITEFSYKLSTLQYQLPACETLEEICLALTDCLKAMDCKGLYLVLDHALFDYGSFIDFDAKTGGVSDTADHFLTEGYSDTMELVYAWQQDRMPRFFHRKPGKALDATGPRGPRENHLFAPLHFMEYTVGYLSIWNCVELVRINCVSAVVNTLTMALRSFFSRKRLSHVNRLLSGISMQDDLTGLYNRLGYHNLAYPLFSEEQAAGGRLGIMFIDLDGLKDINDSYGHARGDQAIVSVANALRRAAPRRAIPVRYGGDEFLLLTPAKDEAELEALFGAILEAVPAEARALGLEQAPGVSAGYVLTEPGSPQGLDDYVARADALMYAEKKRRKQCRQ